MAAEEINEEGGIDGKQIEIVEYDIQSDETQAAQSTTTLTTQDQVSAIVGPALTGTFKQLFQLLTRMKLLLSLQQQRMMMF